MTTTNTPRLGLMSPVDSDLFLSSDFSTTFGKIDAVPGTFIVANQAALSASPFTSWGTAQNGTRVLALDSGAEWFWNAGSFHRLGSLGVLTISNQTTPVSTTVVTPGPTFNTTGNFSVVGGRALRVDLQLGIDNSSGNDGIVIVTIYDNSTSFGDYNFKPGLYVNTIGVYNLISLFIPASSIAPNSTHNITCSIRSAGLSTGQGGHGTSVARQSVLTVTEV